MQGEKARGRHIQRAIHSPALDTRDGMNQLLEMHLSLLCQLITFSRQVVLPKLGKVIPTPYIGIPCFWRWYCPLLGFIMLAEERNLSLRQTRRWLESNLSSDCTFLLVRECLETILKFSCSNMFPASG